MKNGNWLITQDGARIYCEGIKRAEQIGIEGVEDFFNQRREMEIDTHGIAHVHVTGTLLNNPPNIEKVLGNTSYQDIRADIAAANEAGANAILLDIDSPGGMAEGAFETAQVVASSDAPVWAMSEGLMTSAAYFIAAGADRIEASTTSTGGNIGTVLRWQSAKELFEEMGVKQGSYTNEGADLKDIDYANPTEAQAEFIQESINDSAALFQDFVAANRPNLDAEVMRAGYYGGEKAQALGLVDAVGTKAETYGRMVEAVSANP